MIKPLLAALAIAGLQACSGGDPIEPERYARTDSLVATMTRNIEQDPKLQLVADIDHSRLAREAGSAMPPARVLVFSNADMETALIQHNPLLALELPARILAFESPANRQSYVIHNGFDYLVSRYRLTGDTLPDLRERYESTLNAAAAGVPAESRGTFDSDQMQPDGIITLESPYNFQDTIARIKAAIDEQDDTLYFAEVDFQANARQLGVEVLPSHMILFGAPGPGGAAMVEAPTLGLDGFCQKFLVWQDETGVTYLSFNDLLALANRQRVSIPLALRVIDFRLSKTFEAALAPE